jgi:hypothetical protein
MTYPDLELPCLATLVNNACSAQCILELLVAASMTLKKGIQRNPWRNRHLKALLSLMKGLSGSM